METVVGIFKTRAETDRAIEHLRAAGISNDQINLLSPDTSQDRVKSVPVSETEPPGVGKAIGGVVGGAIGAATGVSLGAAAAAVFVPGVGPVIALGIVGAAILGAVGAKAGEALEEHIAEGLPVDELFVYEDALRQGRSVLIITPDDDQRANVIRTIFEQAGAVGIDSAREDWWLGLRDAEEEHYDVSAEDFKTVEPSYRRGFEAALRPQTRGRAYDEAVNYLMANYPDAYSSDSFRRGYERGQSYYLNLTARHKGLAG